VIVVESDVGLIYFDKNKKSEHLNKNKKSEHLNKNNKNEVLI